MLYLGHLSTVRNNLFLNSFGKDFSTLYSFGKDFSKLFSFGQVKTSHFVKKTSRNYTHLVKTPKLYLFGIDLKIILIWKIILFLEKA